MVRRPTLQSRFKLPIMNEILEQIKTMSRADQLGLIREITMLLDEEESELSDEQVAELRADLEAYERDQDPGESWEIVRASIIAGVTHAGAMQERIVA